MATFTRGGDYMDFQAGSGYRTYYDPILMPNWMKYSSLQSALLLMYGKAAKIGTPNSQFTWENFVADKRTLNIEINKLGETDGTITVDPTADATMLVAGDVIVKVGDPSKQYYIIKDANDGKYKAKLINSTGITTVSTSVAATDYNIIMRLGTLSHTLSESEIIDLASHQDIEYGVNYLGLIEEFAAIDKTTAATIVVPGQNYTKRELRQLEILERANKGYEKLLWTGALMKDTSNNLMLSKGFFNFSEIMDYTTNLSGFDWDDFNTFCREYVTKYNNKQTLTAFANKRMLGVIGSMVRSEFAGRYDARGKLVGSDDDRFGMRVRNLTTDYVDLNIYENGALTDIYGDTAVLAIVDLPLVKIRYLEGNGISEDLHLETDIGGKIPRQFLDRASANVGMQLLNPQMHSALILT